MEVSYLENCAAPYACLDRDRVRYDHKQATSTVRDPPGALVKGRWYKCAPMPEK